jgi:hypothetical protein
VTARVNSSIPGTTPSQPGTGPTTGSTSPASSTTATTVSLSSVDWDQVAYPLESHCSSFRPPVLVLQTAYVSPSAGVRLALNLVRCNAGAGSPPVALYVYDGATSRSDAHLLSTLISDNDNWLAGSFNASASSVSIAVAGFSTNSVPNCCPDVQTTLTWLWDGSGFRLTSAVPPHVTGGGG